MNFSVLRTPWLLFFIFVLSLCVRIAVYAGYLQHDNRYWQVDSVTYHNVAQNIADGKGISQADGSSHFYRLPGYPSCMAGLYKIFGKHPDCALWVQVILASCIPVLVFFLALSLFPAQAVLALSAALISSVHLGFVLYSGFYMTESLFLIFFLLFAIFFFRSSMRDLVLSGFFLGLASFVRPVGHYVVVLGCVLLIGRWLVKRYLYLDPSRRSLRCSSGRALKNTLMVRNEMRSIECLEPFGINTLLFFLAWLVPVSIWLIRNFMLTGYLFFHTLPGGHFLYLSAARVVMRADDVSYAQARKNLSHQVDALIKQRERELKRPLLEIESCKIHESLAVKQFLKHPLIACKVWATDMFRTCFSLYSAELVYLESGRQEINYFDKDRSWLSMFKRYLFPQTDSLWLRLLVYTEILFFMCMLIGLCIGLFGMSRGNFLAWLQALGFMGLFVVLALSGGYARMRLPVEPFLIILSLYGWALLFKRKRGV